MSRQESGLPGIYSGNYPPGFEEYNTQYGGRLERIGAKLWDTQLFTSASTTFLSNFFNVRATTDISNMETAFQLPAPKAFLVRSIRVFFKIRPIAISVTPGEAFAANMDNIAQLINTGVLTFTVGNKQYAQEPLWALTAGGGAFGTSAAYGGAAAQVGIDYAQNGMPDPRAVNTLSVPLFLAPQINFNARIDWAAALTLTGNINVCVCLDGDMLRPVQ